MSDPTRRKFLEDSLLAAAAAVVPKLPAPALANDRRSSAHDVLRVGVVGVRGRGRAHVAAYGKLPDAEVVAICDADEGVIGPAMKAAPGATFYTDVRAMLEDETIDVVSLATPNHWHALGTIWALQAGKHVYVEKPISHNVFEGRRVVEAAQKYGRIVACGTQGRSSAAVVEAMRWLHAGGLGEVKLAVGLCYKRRKSIGKVEGPQAPPATVDYDLWTGPAALRPLRRKNLHYDWHWVFDTGNGDLGNQGVHQMDIARWGLGCDGLPHHVTSCGGRFGYDDDGETPNTLISLLDYGDRQLRFEVRGLETSPYRGARVGVVFHGEHGQLVVADYEKIVAFDHDGKVLETFTGGGDHFRNFLDAVHAGDSELLTADVREGHVSAALCHLGNISYRLGDTSRLAAHDAPFGEEQAAANESFARFRDHLVGNGLDPEQTDCTLGPKLAFDPVTERFTGEHAERANPLLTRAYRAPFVVPDRF